MPLSQYQWERVGECDECGAPVYYNEDEGRLTSQCTCMTVDPNSLPEWVRADLGYDDSDIPFNDDSMARDNLGGELDGLRIIDEDEL